jgi:hypothetical protein
MIKGFLESVEPLQIIGWVYDTAAPATYIEVIICCNDRVIDTVTASLYRKDLADGGIGLGDHAFVVNLKQPLSSDDIGNVSAKTTDSDGTPITLSRLLSSPAPPLALSSLVWPHRCRDVDQRPIFILGSARSGTSAITHALLTATHYAGQEEGHLLDILAALAVEVRKFYIEKSDEWGGSRNTMIARVPQRFMEDALDSILLTATKQLFKTPHWLDKTPNSNMIYLAPRFLRIWPNARFIFMKRRAIENIASRMRKFHYNFAHNCREWTESMQAWMSVRDKLAGSALEVDQIAMLRDPETVADNVSDLLELSDISRDRLKRQLARERPQRTSINEDAVGGIEDQGWTSDMRQAFEEICGPTMDKFGYNRTAAYYDEPARLGIVRVGNIHRLNAA